MYCSLKIPTTHKGEDYLVVVTEFDYAYSAQGVLKVTIRDGYVVGPDGFDELPFDVIVSTQSDLMKQFVRDWLVSQPTTKKRKPKTLYNKGQEAAAYGCLI